MLYAAFYFDMRAFCFDAALILRVMLPFAHAIIFDYTRALLLRFFARARRCYGYTRITPTLRALLLLCLRLMFAAAAESARDA